MIHELFYFNLNLLKIVEESLLGGIQNQYIYDIYTVTKPGIVDAVVGGKFNKNENGVQFVMLMVDGQVFLLKLSHKKDILLQKTSV